MRCRGWPPWDPNGTSAWTPCGEISGGGERARRIDSRRGAALPVDRGPFASGAGSSPRAVGQGEAVPERPRVRAGGEGRGSDLREAVHQDPRVVRGRRGVDGRAPGG